MPESETGAAAVGLSRPLRLGGGAFGGSFLPIAAGAGATVESLACLNGVPCLCFGTSGGDFLGLPVVCSSSPPLLPPLPFSPWW